MNDIEKQAYKSVCSYAPTQRTKCAGCGEYKHTPLRNDEMGGYVCLTCIDRELERLQLVGDRQPDASKTEGDKHVGISDVLSVAIRQLEKRREERLEKAEDCDAEWRENKAREYRASARGIDDAIIMLKSMADAATDNDKSSRTAGGKESNANVQ